MTAILVIDDDRSVRHLVSKAFDGNGIVVETASNVEEGLQLLTQRRPTIDVCLLDIMLPGISGLEAVDRFQQLDPKLPIIFITSMNSSDTAIEAMKRGAYDYIVKPLDIAHLHELVARAVEIRRKMLVPVGVAQDHNEELEGEQILGTSLLMQDVYKAIGRVASQDVSVLVQGESGTGKELVARAIYQHSNRADRPFLAVNCAAIPGPLLESELFGYEKGAFTGADRRRIGKFEQCNGGTIFLDEIGDMPGELQSKMLRLLQQQEFSRVGGNETIQTDVRIIAATNQDLEKLVEEGTFREDLYYRLKGFLICLPPLRERGEDIVILVQRFLTRFNRQLGKQIDTVSPEVMAIFKKYHWPGNVREFENVMRQTMLQATGSVLLPEFLPALACYDVANVATEGERRQHSTDLADFVEGRLASGTSNLYAESIEFLERYLLPSVLRATDGNQSQAATLLGITRGSLRNKIRTLNISIEQVVSFGHSDTDSDASTEESGCC